MRIAIFTDSFLPQINGVVTVTLNLAEHLADRGNHIYIICPKYKGIAEYRHKNITVRRVPSIPAFFYDEFRFTPFLSVQIINYLRRERVDVIHFQTPVTLGMQAVLAARMLKLPLVGTYHTLISDPQYLKHVKMGSRMAQRLSWSYAKMYYDRCDLITCPTNIVKRELTKQGFKAKIIALSNGLELKDFVPGHWRAMKRKYNPRGPLLLFAGRIAYEKNLPYLIDCFAMVHRRVPSAKLLIVGDGPQMKEIRSHARAAGLSKAVIFAGVMKHERLLRSGIFKACDLFVTASTTEVQPMAVLEAQASGLPAVGVKAMGVAEVIQDGYNGILVKDHDKEAFSRAVVKLLQNDSLRKRFSDNALASVQNHDMHAVAAEWERRYSELARMKRKV